VVRLRGVVRELVLRDMAYEHDLAEQIRELMAGDQPGHVLTYEHEVRSG
jgi:hypothetical protein